MLLTLAGIVALGVVPAILLYIAITLVKTKRGALGPAVGMCCSRVCRGLIACGAPCLCLSCSL